MSYIPQVHMYGRSTLESLFECLGFFNSGHSKISLKAFGSNVSKGIEVAQILKEEFGLKILKSELGTFRYRGIALPMIEIPLTMGKSSPIDHPNGEERSSIDPSFGRTNFIGFSTYHLMFSWYLEKYGTLEVKVPSYKSNKRGHQTALTIKKEGNDFRYSINTRMNSQLYPALMKAGIIWPSNWQEIAYKLSKHDDVILGLDTNIFYNCSITTHLFPAVSVIEQKPYAHTPNWLLLIVPGTVMYELEEAANIRNDKGFLHAHGRAAFRALQEILELSENIDIPGVSLLISGETDPIFDLRGDISGIRKDMRKMYQESKYGKDQKRKLRKSSSGDMTIRTQFKKFLRQVDFHKGTHFLTSDKSNAALAMAEGLNPLYVGPPIISGSVISPQRLVDEDSKNDLVMNTPLGSTLYEFAVTFGEIIVKCGPKEATLSCDGRGASLDSWLHKQLRIDNVTLGRLINKYDGRFNAKKAEKSWNSLTRGYENIDWLNTSGDAFVEELNQD